MRKRIFSAVAAKKFSGKPGGAAGPLLLLLVGCAVLVIFYFASLSKGSRDEFAQAQPVAVDPAEAERLLAEADSAESQFNSIHEFKKDQITDEDVDIYERAVELYRSHLAASGAASSYNPRYEQMRRHLHNLRADMLRRRSSEIEARAEEAATRKEYQEAEQLFADAARLEVRIVSEFPLATKKNHARANFLENRAKTMHAIPLNLQAQRLETEGEAALDAGNWAKANACLTEALAIERELWANYRNVIVSNSNKILRLQNLLTTVMSAHDYEARERFVAEARAAAEAGDWEKAGENWDKALETQRALMMNFPRSIYAAKSVEEEIERERDDARAMPDFLELRKEYAQMRELIRSRDVSSVPRLAKQVLRRAEKILRQWPSATLVPQDLITELRYMDVKAPDIAGVQENFMKLLLPVPGAAPETRMMKTEVSQALYTFVMPFNPSARKDFSNPVESVDYNDATEFCRRLSLLLGCPVRLPTQTEFAAAAGTPSAETIHEQAWLIENSSGTAHPVGQRRPNDAGFFDLYGNVAEWVAADPENAGKKQEHEEFVAGGDCQTPVYAFPDDFFKNIARSEKSRTRGFRVVAELPADAPAVPAARQ